MAVDKQQRSAVIQVRTYPRIRRALEKAAKDDDRSISSFIERAITRELEATGYLPPADYDEPADELANALAELDRLKVATAHYPNITHEQMEAVVRTTQAVSEFNDRLPRRHLLNEDQMEAVRRAYDFVDQFNERYKDHFRELAKAITAAGRSDMLSPLTFGGQHG